MFRLAFKVSDIESFIFNNMKDIEEYASKEKEKVKYIPIEEFINNNSVFMDDEFFGRGKQWISFNRDGFTSFCSTFGIPLYFINELTEANLASHVLNNYVSNSDVKEQMARYQFVVDTDNNTVLGVVSKTYQNYYNKSLLEDLKKYFPEVYKKFEVSESYVINTNLYLRLLSPKIKAGLVTGRGGTSEDVSRIGLQLSNSLVGDSSVKINFYVLRLLCANGLTIDSLNSNGKVMHSGKEETFKKRLEAAISPLLKDLKTVPNMLKTLAGIEFIPASIVEVGGADEVYSIIPLDSDLNSKRKKLKGDKLKQFDIDIISGYPQKYAGEHSSKIFNSYFRNNQSMFDFINVFTEYARTNNIGLRRRLEIEQRTGAFVNWIIKNKGKIEKQNKQITQRAGQVSF